MKITVDYQPSRTFGVFMENYFDDYEVFLHRMVPYHEYITHLYENGMPTRHIARKVDVPESLVVTILEIEGYL